jgi:radical SAM protein with 4Fe4S-binding SPASM domain
MKIARLTHLNFAVTLRCNSRCIHCDIWKTSSRGELKADEIERLVVESPLLEGIGSVGLTGGEPFLRRDLEAICELFSRRHPQAVLGIATHGMPRLRIAERVLALRDRLAPGRLGIAISIDGTEQAHDRQRGIDGAFRGTLTTVETLLREGQPVCLSFTITPGNYRDLRAVYELARSLGAGFLARFAQQSFYYDNLRSEFSWEAGQLASAEAALNEVIAEIFCTYDLRQPALDPYIYFLTRAAEYQRRHVRLTPCLSGSHSLFIDAVGRVYPCIMREAPWGNIREHALDEIYSGSRAAAVRASIAREECHCWTECETVHTLEKLPECLQWHARSTLQRFGVGVKEVDGVLHAVRDLSARRVPASCR